MSERRQFRDLVTPQTAKKTIESIIPKQTTEKVKIDNVGGRILAERIDAPIDVPGFDRSTVDGYAVLAADTYGSDERDPTLLTVTGTVHAGDAPATTLTSGEAIEISTGAVIPPGADAVVMVEQTRKDGDTLLVEIGVAPGDNIMAAGADIGVGQRCLGPGDRLGTRDVALLSALGLDTVPVIRRPRVGIISTGDELVRPGEPIEHARGQIYDVNSHSIATAVTQAGGEPLLYPHVTDDPAAMRDTLETAARETDLILSSGSTSASTVDVLYDVIEERGTLLHHGVAIKPGKPMLIGRFGVDNSAYIGLPGFPVSAVMVFRQFVAPIISKAAGEVRKKTESIPARMLGEERFDEGRMRLLPVGLVHEGDGTRSAYPVDKGSGATTSLANADGVVEVPANTSFVGIGDGVTVNLFGTESDIPSILLAGEDDPLFSRFLDTLEQPRFLPVHSREALRRFERGIPDGIVIDTDMITGEDGEPMLTWEREWGIVTNPATDVTVEGLTDLSTLSGHFAGVRRTALAERFEEACEEAGISPEDIPGYGLRRPAIESGVRHVQQGRAQVGLGLTTNAIEADLDILPLGTQSLSLYMSTIRTGKRGIMQCREKIDDLTALLHDTPGYHIRQ